MDLKSAIDHIKRSTVPTDKWKADDFTADNCPPEAGEMEAAFAAIMNAVADGTLAQAAGTFAQGIEAAAGLVETMQFNSLPVNIDHIRALSPTPHADPVREAARVLLDALHSFDGKPVSRFSEDETNLFLLDRLALRDLAQKGE